MFADQFEQDGSGFVYRRSQKGDAIRVSAEERSRLIDEYDRNLRRATWITYPTIAIVLVGIVLVSVLRGSDLSEPLTFVGILAAVIPILAYNKWAWSAPARELAARTPVAGERPPEEVRRLQFQRINYGQLAITAVFGILLPFIVAHGDPFAGWNRMWLVIGGALVLLSAVQAFRKWRVEQDDAYRDVPPSPSSRQVIAPAANPLWPANRQLWRYLPLAIFLLGFAFIAYTSAGKRLAQTSSFWLIILIGLAAWALFTVARGFTKGRIEPFVRGFYTVYDRETQPKRFWASMMWNSVVAGFMLWAALLMVRPAPAPSLEDRCSDSSQTLSKQDALSACNRLISLRPKDSGAYVDRGLIFLSNMKLDQAVADFSRAHELDPASAWPLANRGMSYALKSDRSDAENDFAAVRAIDPANPVLFHGEAVLNMESGNLEAAIKGLDVELARHPDDLWSLGTRADAYQQRGDFAKARADRERLEQLEVAARAPAT